MHLFPDPSESRFAEGTMGSVVKGNIDAKSISHLSETILFLSD